MRYLQRILWITAISFTFLVSSSYAKDSNDASSSPKSGAVWTEADWIQWWDGIEDLYLSGMSEEGLYWLLKHDLEVLGQSVDILNDFPFPLPDPNWGGGVGDPTPPTSMKSETKDKGTDFSKYGGYPQEWEWMIDEHGLDPNNFQGIYIPPPPMWVPVSINTLGATLTQTRLPHASATGAAFVIVAGVIFIWIDEAEGDDEDE